MILSHEELQGKLQIKQNTKMMNYLREREIGFMLDGQGKCITDDQLLVEHMTGTNSDIWEFSS